MNNLFNFEYQTQQINNLNDTPSRFSVVYGQDGFVIHTKKDAYSLISTEAISNLGNAFIEKGYGVSSFTHRSGEVIGLNINLGQQMSQVGDKTFRAYITIPNNGNGSGHNLNYKTALDLMQESLEKFVIIQEMIMQKDLQMDSIKQNSTDVMKLLNEWFFEHEMPANHKEGMTSASFRRLLVEDPDSIKCIDRYNQLRGAFMKELEYNEQLGLNISNYTVYATISNYLTRRTEKSQSIAPIEIMEQRASKKLEKFEHVLLG